MLTATCQQSWGMAGSTLARSDPNLGAKWER